MAPRAAGPARTTRTARTLLAAAVCAALAGACTAPPPPPARVGMVVVGDAGSGDATQQAVADAMARWSGSHQVDALATTGDNVYPDGNPAAFAARLDAPYRALTAKVPMWATLGNHDTVAGHGDAQLAHLGLPGRHYEKALVRGTASVQVLVVDSNSDLAAEARWLDERLSAGTYRWRVVLLHHPAWSCGTHGGTAEVERLVRPVVEAHGTDVVLQGHDHLYQRFVHGGTQWVVTGGGGMPLYPLRPCAAGTPPLAAAAVRHHFVALEATATTLVVTAVLRDGTAVDRVELHRP